MVQRERSGPIVSATGSHFEDDRVDKGVLEEGMQVLTKPFALHILEARVRDMLEG
jgi:DNA-binding response OmpR family regulator